MPVAPSSAARELPRVPAPPPASGTQLSWDPWPGQQRRMSPCFSLCILGCLFYRVPLYPLQRLTQMKKSHWSSRDPSACSQREKPFKNKKSFKTTGTLFRPVQAAQPRRAGSRTQAAPPPTPHGPGISSHQALTLPTR